jgi:hypothetical protein
MNAKYTNHFCLIRAHSQNSRLNFEPLMMQTLHRQSEQLRAGANCHLLGAMRRIEERGPGAVLTASQ